MNSLHRLAGRIFNVPLAIDPRKGMAILYALGPRLGLTLPAATPEIRGDIQAAIQTGKQDRKPYDMTADGIAVIDVSDTLVRKASGLDAWSGLTSYEQLESEWCAAVNDPDCQGVLALFDSPGGEVGGLFDLVDKLYSLKGSKPVYASVSECAASAAYAIASVCDQIFLTQTACVGSIGVWCLHMDESEFDKNVGVKYTYVYAGERKIDGNPFNPLSDEAKAVMQDEIDRTYGLFVDSVARNRKMAAKKVRDTEAGVFFGPDGVTRGLADKVGTTDDAIAALRSAISDKQKKPGSRKAELMPAIPPHKTATSDGAWDGPAAKKNLREGESQGYYEKAYAFRDADKDASTKSAYDFIHHEVSESGDVGAANIKGCESGIGVLNGGRGGTKLEGADRKGVYDHLAKHIRDSGAEPPELKSEQEAAVIAASAATQQKEANMAEDMKNDKKDEKDDKDEQGRRGKKGDDYMGKDKKDDDKDGDGKDAKGKSGSKDDDCDEDAKKAKAALEAGKKMAHAEFTEITEFCELAGMKEKAADFIKANKSVDEVRKALVDERAKRSGSVILFPNHGNGTGGAMNFDSLVQQATEYARSNRITSEQAVSQMLERHPEVYASHRREMIARDLRMKLGDMQIPQMFGAQPTQYDVHVNQPLSNISIAYIQKADAFVAPEVFPNVPVEKQSDLYYTYTRADFNTVKFQPRAADGKSAGAGYRVNANSSYLAIVQALHKDIPDQVRANMDAVLSGDRDAAIWLTQQYMLKRELDFVNKFMSTGIWTNNTAGGAAVSGSIGAGGSTVVYWDNASSTPIEDVRNASRQMQLSSGGFRPTDLTLGRAVFDHLLDHPDIIDRVKYTGTEGSPAKGTKEILAELFEVDNVHVMDAVYNTAADGLTESNSLIGGKNALLTYRPAAPSLLTPSAGYMFSWTGLFGMGPLGTRIKTFRVEEKAKDVVEMEAAYDMKIVSADLGFFFSNVTQS